MAYALDVANEWRELLGLARDAKYDAVAAGLGGLPLDPAEAAPTYSFNAEASCCYTSTCPPGRFGGLDQCSPQGGHPSPAAVLGLLNGRRFGDRYGVDQATANNTVAAITCMCRSLSTTNTIRLRLTRCQSRPSNPAQTDGSGATEVAGGGTTL